MSAEAGARSLDDAFMEVIRENLTPEKVLPDLIARELGARGIALSAENLDALRQSIRDASAAGSDSFTIAVDETKHPGLTSENIRSHVNEVGAGLSASLEKFTRRLSGGMSRTIIETAAQVAPSVAAHIRKRRSRALKRIRRERQDSEEAIREHWRLALDALECEIETAIEIWLACDARSDPDDRSARRIRQAIGCLHSRGCQIANEILVLLRNGYADGAHARWRSLHEVATVAWFIHSQGERTALRFIEHAAINEKRQLQSELKAWPARASDPRVINTIRELTVEVDRLTRKYGSEYAGDYGWAAKNLKPPKAGKNWRGPTFLDIEKCVDMDFLRPHYGLANLNVHASALSMNFRLGLGPMDGSVVALAGASPYGLGDPGALTARSLLFLTLPLLKAVPSFEGVVSAKVFELIMQDTIRRFEGGTRRSSKFDPQPVCFAD